jgi:FTR1 family protein
MFGITLVVFREVFEISLIVGILMAATKGLEKRVRWMGIGILLGIVGAVLIAFFADAISQGVQGMGQEMLNATILLVAAILIGWTTLWMTRHGRQLTQEFKHLGQEVIKGHKPLYTLAIVVALSVLREGAEIVMFTYSAFVTGEKVPQLIMGGLLGMSAGVGVGIALYYGLTKVPTKKIFAVTSWFLILLVAGMVAQAFGYLTAAGKVPEIIPTAWDTSKIVSEGSFLGKIMHVLVGYTDRPSGVQLLAYFLTIGGLVMALKVYARGGIQLIKKVTAVVIVGAACLVVLPQEAHATNKVYSPIVEQGELEIEFRGQYDVDERSSKDNAQKYKYAIGYGVTNHWFTEIYGESERTKNEEDEDLNFKFTAISWENRFQLTEQGQFPVDVGAYLEYEASFENKHPDKLEAKLLLEKSLTKFTHTLNLSLEQQVGWHPGEDLAGGLAWSSKYRLKQWFQPGIEWYSDFGEIGQMVSYQDQKHQLGPVFYGKVGHVKYDVGYLFGMSDAAPKGEIKWIAEYEFRF